MLRLFVTDSSGERRFATERNEVLIGRREGVDLRLTEAASSRNHCLLRIEGQQVRLVDLGSVNGTKVGGRKVEQALLGPGDEFRIGGTVLRVAAFSGPEAPAGLALEEESEPPAPAPPRPPAAPIPAYYPQDEFVREIRAMVSQAPWYTISLVAHIVLLLILNAIPYTQRQPEHAPRMVGVLPPELAPAEQEQLKGPEMQELPEPDALDEELDFDEALSKETRKDPGEPAMAEMDDLDSPAVLGLDRGRTRIIRLRSPLPVTSNVVGSDERLNKGDIHGEQGRARDAVQRDLGEGIRQAKRRLGPTDIVVVEGNFDKIEKVLDAYDWPYKLIDLDDLQMRGAATAKLLFINCRSAPGAETARKVVPMVKEYVQRGCWVVTSDWSACPYLTEGFPDRVTAIDRGTLSQRDTTISVHPDCSDSLLTGVFPLRGDSLWWLEERSQMLHISRDVDLLVSSDDLQERFGTNVVMFRFKYGRGRVLHLLGHFYQKDGNRRGLVAMHRLINNLILERIATSN